MIKKTKAVIPAVMLLIAIILFSFMGTAFDLDPGGAGGEPTPPPLDLTLSFWSPPSASIGQSFQVEAIANKYVLFIKIYLDGVRIAQGDYIRILTKSITINSLGDHEVKAVAKETGNYPETETVFRTTRTRYSIVDPEPNYSPNNLGTDWGRHPSMTTLYTTACNFIQEYYGTLSNLNPTEAAIGVWNGLKQRFRQIYNDPEGDGYIRQDYALIDGTDGNTPYYGKCYSASIGLSGLLRSIGIPSRSIQIEAELYNYLNGVFYFLEDDTHVFAEVYLGSTEGWIVCCADETFVDSELPTSWGWWGWEEFGNYITDSKMVWNFNQIEAYVRYDHSRVISVGWVYEIISSDGSAWVEYTNYLWRAHNYEYGSEDSIWSTWNTYYNIIAANTPLPL